MIKNILTDEMPDTISVNGILFEINTDFRIWIKIGYLLNDLHSVNEEFSIFEQICELAIHQYPKQEFVYAEDMLYGIVEFYKGFPKLENDAQKNRKKNENEKLKTPTFDFVFDAEYIYCSFYSLYGIRLQAIDYMHWWEFLTLFQGLMMSEDTSMNFIVGTRQQKIKPNMSKEEKARLQKLQKEFALPLDEKTQKSKEKLTDILSGKKKTANTVNTEQ